jgi:methyltransferase-like protein/ubiquinone/menaquinone biosynthesis C-methylase UbiE
MYHYDKLPYESNPFAETHPRALAMLGELFRLPVANPEKCRVLELGCAAGGNLLPMAWHLPGSEFVGIDLEAAQVEEGKGIIAELGLANIHLAQGDITQLGEELGQFDYIIAHGVFSWVPEPVRQATFALYKKLLKPHGVGYISYNTRPGWHVRGMVREMLLYHTHGIDDPLASLNAAMDFIVMYAETLKGQAGPLAQHLLLELESLKNAHPSYIYHEYLEANNQPLLVSEFLEQAASHGLKYLCECQLEGMFAADLGEQAESFLAGLEDNARHEQYLDFFNHRTFRQSLLVHDVLEPDYDIDLGRMQAWACASNLVPPYKLELRHSKPQVFTTQDGKAVEVGDPVTRAMLAILHQYYPSALPVKDLLTQAHVMVQQAHGKKSVAPAENWHGELFNLYANCLVQLSPQALNYDNTLTECPRLNSLARTWVEHGARNIPTIWHQSLNIDPFSLRVLQLLDGQHNRQSLETILLAELQAGKIELPGIGRDTGKLRPQVSANLSRLLGLFAHSGILVAE